MTLRVGMLVTHPVQYLSPWFRQLATRLDLEVFYAHRQDARGQAQAGFGVEFEWDTPLLEGYRYRWLKNVARRPGLGSFFGCDTPEIAQIIEQGRFDAFVIFGWNTKSYLQAIHACRRHGVRALVRGDSQLTTRRSKRLLLTKEILYRLVLPRLGYFLYVGRRNQEYLAHYGVPINQMFFVPHFVDAVEFGLRASTALTCGLAAKIREENGFAAEDFVFMFVGKLIAKKRVEDLILAFGRISAMGRAEGLQGLIVGDGPLRNDLENLAGRMDLRVRFAGFQNQSSLPAYYAACDVLVLPSDAEETWGLVVNEAQACGKPAVISDDVGCAPDLISGGTTGFTFPRGDVDALAQRILDVRSVLSVDAKKVRDALARKVEAYSMATATERLVDVLTSVCGSRR